ncbi:MAG: NAD-dependent epimerase/dehydratase family protein [Candidatus Heimdallarchaeota archaeon]|nr:NAD-dependent epimerase/dehydratase family protein [Candidatus Heimdallarchaeota archaeon]
MAKIFVTGATGQVGGQLVELIINEKLLDIQSPKDVFCLVRNPSSVKKLTELGATLIEGDLQDSDTISEAMKNGIDYVFHIAANILLNQTYEQMYIPNVLGTRIMLDAFTKSEAKSFIYTSTIAVYQAFNGKKKFYNIDENSPKGTITEGEPYAITKRIAEDLVIDYSKRHLGKNFYITRLGPIVGPGDRLTVPSLVEAMSYRIIPKLINRGKHLFSITHPKDVARAQIFLAQHNSSLSGEAFNVAGESLSFREIMNIIADYYMLPHPKFSITAWFFRFILPLLKVLNKIFPNIKLIKTALSPVTINYIIRTYIYNSLKLCNQGFSFSIKPKDAILDALTYLDPERKLIKPSCLIKAKIARKQKSMI